MSNKPWEKWYWKDWLSDAALQSASPCTRGIWVNVLGSMWQQGVYELTMDRSRFCRLIGCSEAELHMFIEEAQALRFCNVCVTDYGHVTVMSRRRKKEDKRNETNRLRQQRYRSNAKRNAQSNGVDPDPDPDPEEDLSLLSQESNSGDPPNVVGSNRVRNQHFAPFWSAYPVKRGKKRAEDVWKRKNLDKHSEMIIQDVERRKREDQQWARGYTPHAATYLNQERWEDELGSQQPMGLGRPLSNVERLRQEMPEFFAEEKVIEGDFVNAKK